MSNIVRRSFLQTLGTGILGTAVLPATAKNVITPASGEAGTFFFPKGSPDEQFWGLVKTQFPIAEGKIMVNAANLCPAPYVVGDEIIRHARALDTDVSFQHRAQFESIRKETLQALANFLGVSANEIGITRNTSEANNMVIQGLDFQPGDEIVIWDQNHPSNNMAWKQKAKRVGLMIKEVRTTGRTATPEELLQPFAAAIGPKTRMMAFSHISNVSGQVIPAAALCELARARGVLTLIDGAQSFGMLNLNLQALGCDFYTSSSHKWLMGPKETGILYVRQAHLERLWPTTMGAGWKEGDMSVDGRICTLGQRNDALAAAMTGALKFHETIGRQHIEERVFELAVRLKRALLERVPGLELVSPEADEATAGIVIVRHTTQDNNNLYEQLYHQYGIACAPTGGLRFSPTIYNTPSEMDRIAESLRELVG